MVDADDPLTGEKVAASINIWTHVTDIVGQSLVDLVRYTNGELTTADITNGTYIDNWAKAAKLAADGAAPTMTLGSRSTSVARPASPASSPRPTRLPAKKLAAQDDRGSSTRSTAQGRGHSGQHHCAWPPRRGLRRRAASSAMQQPTRGRSS